MRVMLLLVLALSGCAVGYNLENGACTVSFSPSGEAVKAFGDACMVAIDKWKDKGAPPPAVVVKPSDPEVAVVPTPVPVPVVMPTLPPETAHASCKGTPPKEGAQRVPDGGGGFLWKNGDSTKKVVVLMSCTYGAFDRVTLKTLRGKSETLQFTGWGNPDQYGDRQHYRGSLPTGRYEGRVIAEKGGKVYTWEFKNASRVD